MIDAYGIGMLGACMVAALSLSLLSGGVAIFLSRRKQGNR